MNPVQLMELKKGSFTNNDLAIYAKITEDPERVISQTAGQLAASCGVSQPALSRFVKALGYGSYRDFRADFIALLALQAQEDRDRNTDRTPYFSTLFSTLEASERLLTDAYLSELADYVCSHRRVFASGVGKSSHPAQLFETLMRRNRFDVHAVSADGLDELVDFMGGDDLLIMFSVNARARNMMDAVRASGHLMLVTANASHDYHDEVDLTVALPYASTNPESASVSPILFDVFVELLTETISRRS